MKHILFFSSWYPTRNDLQNGVFAQKHAQALALHYRVSVLTLAPDAHSALVITVNDRCIEFVAYYKQWNTRLKILNQLLNVCSKLLSLIKGICKINKSEGKPDLYHANVYTWPVVCIWFAAKFCKKPFFYTEHWSGFMTGAVRKQNFVYRKLNQAIAKNANAISAVSHSLKDAMIAQGVSNRHFYITHNVVEVPNTSRAPIINPAKILLTVADLRDDIKNVSSIIKVVAELSSVSSTNLEFHIIGDGPDSAMLQALAYERNLLGTVIHFLGRQPNIFVLHSISNADVCIINSNVETFSVFTAESIAQGVPVIATRCGGTEEIITEKCGILIEKNNDAQLKEAIRLILSGSLVFNKAEMKHYALSRYGMESIGKAFMAMYNTAEHV